MTLQAPSHREWRNLADSIHVLYWSVALLARNSREDVLAVVEVHEVGKVMDLDPADGPPELHGFLQLLDFNRLFFYNAVAVHAHAFRRDSSMAAGARSIVTIKTRNLVIACMNLVREVDRLLG